jgi:hypothetical protein
VEKNMSEEEKKGKIEKSAEKTGELGEKGVKTGWGIVKTFGKGMKNAMTKKEEEKEKK